MVIRAINGNLYAGYGGPGLSSFQPRRPSAPPKNNAGPPSPQTLPADMKFLLKVAILAAAAKFERIGATLKSLLS
jgi:hypothetical protein